MTTIGLTLTATASTGLLLAGLQNNSSRILSSGVLTTVGHYSYALYVVHWPVILATDAALRRVGITGAAYFTLFMMIAMGASYTLALISWHSIEKHCLAQKRLFQSNMSEIASSDLVAPASARRSP
jgi:peptidoglycan/LPS O-acetylase OafA/YrhL